MIKKITNINFGIFSNYNWDNNLGKNNEFEKINIIYGRNYSGKTTLSRIVRALETKQISDKYKNPNFEIIFDDGTKINQVDYVSSDVLIRVFNEDFIRENLSFPYDNDGNIKAFALLGEENLQLQSKIDELKLELGDKDTDTKTGLYKELEDKNLKYSEADKNYRSKFNELESNLTQGAKEIGAEIRNYNKTNLRNDIKSLLKDNYKPISDDEKEKFNKLLKEEKKELLYKVSTNNSEFQDLINSTKAVVEQKVGNTEKIEMLVKNAQLNRWVKEGKALHQGKKICAFCGNVISESRWAELDKHFDEEYEKLETNLNKQLDLVEDKRESIKKVLTIDKNKFYSFFINELDELNKQSEVLIEKIDNWFDSLKNQLNSKKDSMLGIISFVSPEDFSADIISFASLLNKVIDSNNEYTNNLSDKISEAKEKLQSQKIYEYCQKINYQKQVSETEALDQERNSKGSDLENLKSTIKEKEGKIDELTSKMSNEKEGASKVNEYLSVFFDSNHLSLSIEENELQQEKQTTFSILRNNEKAYNLSEGECRIIAFCYFFAKLDELKGKNPIIWIDDPVCSLDGNHIFSVYSMLYSKLKEEIIDSNNKIEVKNKYKQLFISTHNLNFLKYLKRYKGVNNENKGYFLIQRKNNNSTIETMPKYMKEYATEFNYLFKQIYECSRISVNDDNYTIFYNFANNARKFLEIYSYYKFPDMFGKNNSYNADEARLKEFWGIDFFDYKFTERLNNEYSHLAGSLERGELPIDLPEIKNVAERICKKIEETDKKQYDALVNSVTN